MSVEFWEVRKVKVKLTVKKTVRKRLVHLNKTPEGLWNWRSQELHMEE